MEKKSNSYNGWEIFGIIWFVIQTYRFGKRGITEGDWWRFIMLYGFLVIFIIIYLIKEKYKKKKNNN